MSAAPTAQNPIVDEMRRFAAAAAGRPPAPPQDTDPRVMPIEDANPEDLSANVLPPWAADHATALAQAKEVSQTMPILLTLAVLSACVQRRYVVRVEQAYHEALCLFIAAAMESGERKSAIHNPILRPLFDRQKEMRSQSQHDMMADKIRRDMAADRIKSMKQKLSKAADNDEAARIEEEIVAATMALPPERGEPQLVVDDFTEAALSVALSSNGESLLVASDEGGLFDNLSGRHSDVSEIDLFLKAHTGAPHTVNRTGRANVFLHRPLLSVAISPQPAVIAKLGGKPGFIERGLTARFLWGLPRSLVGGRRLNPATIEASIIDDYKRNITRLIEVGQSHQGEPTPLLLSAGAYEQWKAFEREIEPRIGPSGDLRPVKPWASKLAGAVARIAAVCHCANHMDNAGLHEVSDEQMAEAISLGRQLVAHAVAVHRLMGSGGATVAAEVVQHYDAAGWPNVAKSLTEWWRPVRKIVGDTSRTFEPVATKLVDHGYLLPCDAPGERRGGPAGTWFRANRELVRKSENP